ncbi:TIM44-like domain-containing protein [Phreatobacter sp.]|uniref:TIM44-like domain-containing protein n=1 Tax=Phreatobacter sp. TaxID=1966341 RepID=UPI003F6EF975
MNETPSRSFGLRSSGSRTWLKIAAIAAVAVFLSAAVAEARRGGSFGSRGTRTQSAPPPTQTAPGTAQPIQRTQTPAPGPTAASPAAAARPAAAPAAQGSRFGALGMGLAAGFIGAGLFGLLSGQGFLAGLGSLMGLIGFLAQIALIAGVIYLIVRFVRGRREQPSTANAYARGPAGGPAPGPQPGGGPLGAAAMGGGAMAAGAPMGAPAAAPPSAPSDEVGLDGRDFDNFERLLFNIEEAYSREDIGAIRAMTTPEVAGYFEEELRQTAALGHVTRLSNVKLLQGDLSEAWRENDADYATVAMRFAVTEVVLERATGRVVSGNPQGEEATELWTFRRPHGGMWQLSAVQQP